MVIKLKIFDELNAGELYEILWLRTEIFVVEQNCVYSELDYHDQKCVHVLGYVDGKLMAYARAASPGSVYQQPSIGRVAVIKEYRSKKYGRKIFSAALASAQNSFPGEIIKIQAQTYLEKFYRSFGFETISAPYPDFGVWHVDMILKPADGSEK